MSGGTVRSEWGKPAAPEPKTRVLLRKDLFRASGLFIASFLIATTVFLLPATMGALSGDGDSIGVQLASWGPLWSINDPFGFLGLLGTVSLTLFIATQFGKTRESSKNVENVIPQQIGLENLTAVVCFIAAVFSWAAIGSGTTSAEIFVASAASVGSSAFFSSLCTLTRDSDAARTLRNDEQTARQYCLWNSELALQRHVDPVIWQHATESRPWVSYLWLSMLTGVFPLLVAGNCLIIEAQQSKLSYVHILLAVYVLVATSASVPCYVNLLISSKLDTSPLSRRITAGVVRSVFGLLAALMLVLALTLLPTAPIPSILLSTVPIALFIGTLVLPFTKLYDRLFIIELKRARERIISAMVKS